MCLPSLQALVGGGLASLLLSHIFQGGLENYLLGWVELKEGVLFFVSQVVFYWIFMKFD